MARREAGEAKIDVVYESKAGSLKELVAKDTAATKAVVDASVRTTPKQLRDAVKEANKKLLTKW